MDDYALKQKQWKDIKHFLSSWLHNLDYQGLQVILAGYTSHFYLKETPVWILVLGTSRTGKSAIALGAIEVLDHVIPLADITPNTFLSGFEAGGGGLLQILNKTQGGNGIVTVSDLSVITSKRPDVVSELLGQLRKIHDGYHVKHVGNQKEPLEWRGKVTMIAAGTWDVERHWAVYRSLGERFLNLCWRQKTDRATKKQINRYAAKQIGNEDYIKSEFRTRMRQFVDKDSLSPVGADALREAVLKLEPVVELITLLRTPITRERTGSRRNVVEIGKQEGAGGVTKALANIARGNATLFRKKDINREDLLLAYRIGLDSVPRDRYKVVALLDKLGRSSATDVIRASRIPKTSLYRVLEDLCCIGVTSVSKVPDLTNHTVYVELTSSGRDLVAEVKSCLK